MFLSGAAVISLNNLDKSCLYNSFNILSSFLINILVQIGIGDEFPKIVPSGFGHFIGHKKIFKTL